MTDRNIPGDDGRRYRTVALAVLSVLAVTLVAAAVAPVFSQDLGGDRPPQIEQPAANDSEMQPTGGPDFPFQPVFVAVLTLCALAIAAQFVDDPWGSLKMALGGAAFLGVGFLIVRALAALDLSPPERNESAGESPVTVTPTPNGSTGFDGGASTNFSWPVESIAVVAVAMGVIAVVVLFVLQSDGIRSTLGLGVGDRSGESDADLDAVGQVAGEAADRVKTASTPHSADNAIYRAWSEMVAILDTPGPQSGTPRQFEAAAVKSGMDPDDVHLLTRIFEEVRYGDAPLSEERHERATAALRRIERRYSGEEEEGVDSGSTASVEHRPGYDGEIGHDGSEENE